MKEVTAIFGMIAGCGGQGVGVEYHTDPVFIAPLAETEIRIARSVLPEPRARVRDAVISEDHIYVLDDVGNLFMVSHSPPADGWEPLVVTRMGPSVFLIDLEGRWLRAWDPVESEVLRVNVLRAR